MSNSQKETITIQEAIRICDEVRLERVNIAKKSSQDHQREYYNHLADGAICCINEFKKILARRRG